MLNIFTPNRSAKMFGRKLNNQLIKRKHYFIKDGKVMVKFNRGYVEIVELINEITKKLEIYARLNGKRYYGEFKFP